MVKPESFAVGATIVVHWQENIKGADRTGVKSNKTSLGKTGKIILSIEDKHGQRPRPGEVWTCKVERITSPEMVKRGAIFVRPLSRSIDYHFEGVWIEPVQARIMATVLQDPRRNLMLEGDQGVGKSTIAAAIADTLNWEFRKISGGLIKKFVYMLGRFIPVPGVNGHGFTMKWVDSKLVEVLREADLNPRKTFLCMIDEFSRIDEDARDVLLDVIEGKKRALRLPTGDEIPVGANVVFMAAANVGEGFVVRRQDAAATDRWEIVKILVMPQPEELAHCMRLYPNCPKTQLDTGLSIVNVVRAARKQPAMRLSKTVSTRRAEALAMYLTNGFPLDVCLQTAVINHYAGAADDPGSESGRVARLIKDELSKRK